MARTQEAVGFLQSEREQLRLAAENGSEGLEEIQIRSYLIQSYTLDCVINYIRTGNYLGSSELRSKLTKQLQQAEKEQ